MDTYSNQRPVSILRIKRKRDAETPDVLLVEPSKESKRRKSTAPGVFQFAETVEASAWKDSEKNKELQNRITELSREPPASPTKIISPATTIDRQSSTASTSTLYRVITKSEEDARPPRNFFPAPPKVISHKDLPAQNPNLKIYDAVLSTPDDAQPNLDPEMEKFNELLKEYLTVSERPSTKSPAIAASLSDRTITPSSSDDYVYDIFIHRPSAPSDLDYSNIAMVTGLPASFDEDGEYDSESEEEDEADEDSNAEDFYRNDYPDEDEWEEFSDDPDDHSDAFHDPPSDEDVYVGRNDFNFD